MKNNDNKISITEVRGRILELIFNMPEVETRQILNELEIRAQTKPSGKRERPRKSVFIPIECKGKIYSFSDFIQNISDSGLFMETKIPLMVGEELSMTFSLSSTEDPIEIKGKIVRVNSKGISVQFDELLTDI
jgi:Tfp pilus assembly protein PilZ